MTLRPQELLLLRRLARTPCTEHALTHSQRGVADVQSSAPVIHGYIETLQNGGYITQRMGVLRVSKYGLAYLARIPAVACSTLVCNASSREPWTGTRWNIRAGGEQHLQFRSLGA